MKNGIIVLTVALSLTLSSCGLYSKYDKTTQVDENLYGNAGYDVGDNSSTLGNMSWRELFTDKKLQSLIEQGLENNTNLQSAILSVEAAKASLAASRLAYLPSVALSGEGTSSGLISGGASTEYFTAVAAVSWEIDIFGKLTNQKLQSKMLFEQQLYVVQAVRSQVVSSIATLYYTLSMLDEQIAIARATELSWSESVEAAKVMKEAGFMNEAGLAQLEASYLSVKSAVLDLEVARKKSENALCGLLAITPQTITTSPLSDVTTPESISVGVPLQMLSSRPDVMAAESALAASFYSRNVARSSFYPSLNLTGAAGWTNYLGSVIVDPAEAIYSIVGELIQPIFTRGLNRAQLIAAKSQFEKSRLAFEQSLIDSGIEVNDAFITLNNTKAKAQLYASQVERLEVAASSTALMMTHGTTTYLEVLTAQQTLYNSQLQLVANRFDQMQSLITLYTALGGGRL
ncbi:MAG: TolC family protein [Rikenellaceae bacterium]